MPRLPRLRTFSFRSTSTAGGGGGGSVGGGAVGAVEAVGVVGTAGAVGTVGSTGRDGDAAASRRRLIYVLVALLCFATLNAVLSHLGGVLPSVQLSSAVAVVLSLVLTVFILLVGLECLVISGSLSRREATSLALLTRNMGAIVALASGVSDVPADGVVGDGDEGDVGDLVPLELA